jgi:hypothetical protein
MKNRNTNFQYFYHNDNIQNKYKRGKKITIIYHAFWFLKRFRVTMNVVKLVYRVTMNVVKLM